MDKFVYRKSADVTMLSASITDFSYKKHAHQEYAVGVTLRGIQQYTMDGALQLSHQNGVMLFNPEQAHDGTAHDRQGLDYVMLYIDPQVMLDAAGQKELVLFDEPIVYDRTLRTAILNLGSAISGKQDEARCTELTMLLAERLTRMNTDVFSQRKESGLINKAKELLHADLSEVLQLDKVSTALGLSKYQFIRMFQSQVGSSPYQYFLNAKIERAKHIIEKEKDVYAAVAACGLTDLTHLNRHFKSIYGITAHEYLCHLLK
ncbi:AraC family transcriptional regulator [Saccharibacillus endophyticus]|uniref:AraC family transcriptional regulator n=1 Tax=Saccharibacillus endophyticus TaxID=2060666 RepID=A0ABQ1ZJK4_9BACL|nr:AraC family transcriptional regulator [Saccharibacillus endophyticus]GGH68748.1 AraC family transcriptional regulator [Saccharibacillus endophyticus]